MNFFQTQLGASVFILTTSITNFAAAGAVSGGGDCYPEEWNLPNKGENCTYVAEFDSEKKLNEVYQLWTCTDAENNKMYLMKFEVIRDQTSMVRGCRVFQEIMIKK